jgi:DNA-binding MurR/RpiR family transcriptional regulator
MPPARRAAPETFDELVGMLQREFDTLTPAQKLLAERIMSDPEGSAFMTITELAAAVGVNEATVVRFATSLGLDGYPALVRLCRERLREQAQLLRRFGNLEQLGSDSRDPLDLAIAFDQANIVRTFSRIDRLSWAAAVSALAAAPAVQVMGLRKCHAPAFLLGYLLRLVRDDVAVLTPAAGTLTDDLRHLKAGDCFVGIAIHRYTADTVRAFRWAQRVGATTIALTDNPSSPLAVRATHTFYVDTAGVAVLRSMAAFTSLVQALATAVATQRGAEVRSALLIEEELLGSFGTYAAEESAPQAARRRPDTGHAK